LRLLPDACRGKYLFVGWKDKRNPRPASGRPLILLSSLSVPSQPDEFSGHTQLELRSARRSPAPAKTQRRVNSFQRGQSGRAHWPAAAK
jgi:hypothetical protein